MTEYDAIDVDAHPLSRESLQIENHNKRSTEILQLNGYNGSSLKKLAPILDLCKINTCVTVPHSRERQYLLAKASTSGIHFHTTGGEFLNSDNFFITEERK